MTDTAPETTPTTEPAAGPVPVVRGRFSLYETPAGGYRLVWRADGSDTDEHADVPPMLVKMARRGGTSPLAALRALTGGM